MRHLRNSALLLAAGVGCTAPHVLESVAPAPGAGLPPLEVTTDTIPGTGVTFEMIGVSGGTFMMGTPATEPGRNEDEGPQVSVTVAPFYLGAHEVTYDEFSLFRSRARDSEAAAPGIAFDPDLVARPSPPYEDPAHGMGTSGHPAVGMTQWGALQYARWLSDKTGRFYRLPTEAEWEYACRAGTVTAYSFGDSVAELDSVAWYWNNSDERYHAVGQRMPNPWGFFDMHGNVAEWTLDQYEMDAYATLGTQAIDPWTRPVTLHPRTVRGGAYDDNPESLRCGARLRSNLDWKRRDPQVPRSMWWNTDSPFVGFRILRPAVEPDAEEAEAFWLTVLGG